MFQRYKRLIITVVIIIIALVAAWLIYFYGFTFSVVSTSPRASQMTVVQPTITIHMTKNISPQNVKIKDDPSKIIDSYKVDGSRLTIYLTTYLNYLNSDNTYKITVQNIDSKTGNFHLKNYVFSFKPSNNTTISADNQTIMTNLQQKHKNAAQAKEIKTHPIVAHLPKITNSYYIKPVYALDENGNQSVSLQANIFIDRADYDANNQAAIAAVEQQVVSYINQYDKAQNYYINYIVQPD